MGEEPITDIRVVAGDYYRAMGIPLLRGRTFNSRDTESSPNVFIINDELVRRHFPGEDPIGKQISFDWGDMVARPRLSLLLLGGFAALALVLAAIGLYGVMAYSVAQRRAEIGVRVALGASRPDVMRLIVGQGMRLTLAGLLVGPVGALALTRLMTSLLFGVQPTDPLTIAAVAAFLAAIALVASWIPARRAAGTDPAIVLRAE